MNDWARKWNIPAEALKELVQELDTASSQAPGSSEAAIQAMVRLKASQEGWRMWRNNVGAHTDGYGRHVRYGLCNESRRINKVIKSSDLIGLRPVLITRDHVGHMIGQFVAIEVKHGSWKPGKSDRESAQANFMRVVHDLGGCAGFSTGELPK